MTAVAEGKLDTRVKITTGDEFEDLANAFESMRRGLLAGQQLRQAFERFVIRNQGGQHLHGQDNDHAVIMQLGLTKRGEAVPKGLEALLGCIQDHGGLVNEIGGNYLQFRFIAAHPDDALVHRATHCALALLSADAPWTQPESIGLALSSEVKGDGTLLNQLCQGDRI